MLFLQATLVEECPKIMLLCIRAGNTDEYIMKSRTLSRFRGVEWHLFLLNKLVLRYSDWLHCSHQLDIILSTVITRAYVGLICKSQDQELRSQAWKKARRSTHECTSRDFLRKQHLEPDLQKNVFFLYVRSQHRRGERPSNAISPIYNLFS